MRYSIGLDVGIASVGFATFALDEKDNPYRIIRIGTRIFDSAEHPKTGASLAQPRREKRGTRRVLRRRKLRLKRIRGIIVSSGLLTQEKLNHLYDGQVPDVYELRVKALDQVISNEELARVLIHIAQRRGFKSNRKSEAVSSENGKLLKAVNSNNDLLISKNYRTIGEMFFKDEKFKDQKRNKSDNYINTVSRDLVENEIKRIFSAQRALGNSYANEDLESKYLDIVLSQRSFADGPASGLYSGNQVERMRGKCTLEKSIGNDEDRAAKASFSFQLFSLLQKINNIRYYIGGESFSLNDEQRKIVREKAMHTSDVDYLTIRKILSLPENAYFANIGYSETKKAKKGETPNKTTLTKEECEAKKRLGEMRTYHELRLAINKAEKGLFETLSGDQLDIIGENISKNYDDEHIKEQLKLANIPDKAIDAILLLPNHPKYGHLSVKACKKIIPFLEEGYTYDKACSLAGYNFQAASGNGLKYLPPLGEDEKYEISSPVVKRAVSQTIKVINAIIREMGDSPTYINIELAREMPKSFEERNKIVKKIEENEEANEKIVKEIRELFGIQNPKGLDIIKFKLYLEQDGISPYSQKTIAFEKLFDKGYAEVDHIYPYSHSFDDRLVNKVLVLTLENREKGDRLPLEYLAGENRDKFIVWVNNQNYRLEKKRLLLKEKMDDEEEFRQRNLQDTQFAATFLANYLSKNLKFAESTSGMKRRVYTLNGSITSYVRKRWGIDKDRNNGDSHHAKDAAVIGCITPYMVQRISLYSRLKENFYSAGIDIDKKTGEVKDRFPLPWDKFREELNIRLLEDKNEMKFELAKLNLAGYAGVDLDSVPPFFVSKMSSHKVTGEAHEETIRSGKQFESCGITVSKTDIKKLKLDKNGEIEGYYIKDKERNVLLYNALKARLIEFGGDGKKAFAQPIYKPKANGTYGPIVKKVRTENNASLIVKTNGGKGVADNGKIVRIDVFYVEGDGYYFVPIYVADTVKDKLPQKACAQGKKSYEWKEMDDANFVFSLYKNDLIKVYSKKDIELKVVNDKSTLPQAKTVSGGEGLFLYFDGLDISTASFSGITHDNTYKKRSIGKTSLKIEKYEVDVLGNIRKVQSEKRKKFNLKKR